MINNRLTKKQLNEEILKLRLEVESLKSSDKNSHSNKLFQDIVEGVADLITLVDGDGNLIFANKNAKEIFGIDSDLTEKVSAFKFVHPDDQERTKEWFSHCINNKVEVSTIENRQINIKTKVETEVLWTVKFQYDLDEKVQNVYSIAQNKNSFKLKENELRESEEKYRLLVTNAPYCIHQINLQGELISMNPAGLKMMNVSNENEIIGMRYMDVVDALDFDKVNEKFKQALNGQTTEFEFKAINGLHFFSSFIPIFKNNNSVIRLMGITQDVTERKNTVKYLQKSKSQLMESQKIANLGHYVLDITKGSWTSSEQLDIIFGMNNEFTRDVPGWLSIVHPEDREMMLNYFQDDILKQHKKFEKEYRVIDLITQKEKWVYGIGNLIFDNDNNPIEMFGTIQDISERKKIEEALRTSEENFRKYISHAPEAIFITNAKGEYIEVNRTACEMTGFSEKELKSMSIPQLVDPNSIEDNMKSFEVLKKTGTSKGEYKLRLKDGSIIVISLNAVAISEDRYMAFCSDISETKRLQDLESRAERLETAGTIAGQVAHDFNNLLAPLIAYPEFIRDELPSKSSAHQFLDSMENASNKIAEINQQLLSLGRRGHYNQEVFNLNTIVNQVITTMIPKSEKIMYSTDLASDLVNINGGVSQVHRVITNLLCNAEDALHGKGSIHIKTENFYVDEMFGSYGRVPKGEYVKLTIKDTGCGISNKTIQKVLDPFFTTKKSDKIRGSGLGLSVVDAVIKDHNGYLDLSSTLGEGTTFYLYFPPTHHLIEENTAIEIIGGNESILIVDDDEIQRNVTCHLLQTLGYEVSTTNCGEDAIEFLKKNPHDMLILDMVMPPGIDGTETYRQILNFNPDQKAIIVSGYSESKRVKEALDLGAGRFVKKPLTKQSIAIAIREEINSIRETSIP